MARAVCRTYAVTPCLVTAVLAATLCAVPWGVPAAAAVTALPCAAALAVVPAFRRQAGRLLANGAAYFVALALPAAVVGVHGWRGFLLGGLLELALDVALLLALPRCGARAQRFVQPELLPDLLTTLLLVVVFALPVRLCARGPRFSGSKPPPWDVAVHVCSHEERATIERCLASIRTAARHPGLLALVRSLRVVLVDSGSTDGTREAGAPLVDAVLVAPAGKLSARHHATVAEPADVVVSADGDRKYDEEFLVALLGPLAEPGVVGTLGETANVGSGMSGSALCRRALAIPMNAGNSACWREAYLEIPFDVTVNQFRHREIWAEEEFLFAIRLRGLGQVIHTTDARSHELRPYPVLDQLRRHLFGRRLRTF